MKAKRVELTRKFTASIGLTIGLWAASGQAQSLTNLAGLWNGLSFGTPARLTALHNPQGLVTNVPESTAFEAGDVQVTFQANGTFTGGSISIGSQGVVNVLVDDVGPISARVNAVEDVFAGIAHFPDSQELNLLLKAPATFVTNDLVGTWNLMFFDTAAELKKIYAPTTNGSALTDLLGFDNNSVMNSSFAQTGTGTMIFNPNGTLSANVGDTVTGNFSIGTNGQASVFINAEDPFTTTAFINVSKDILFALHKEPAFNRQEIIMLSKPAATVTLADLQGAWKVTSFTVPLAVNLTRNSSNWVTAVNMVGDSGANQSAYTQGHDGFLTHVADGEPSTGAVTVGAAGTITVTLTNSSGTQAHSGFLNASKNTILLVESDSGGYSVTVVTRAPAVPGNRQDLGLIMSGAAIYWASGTNRVLQSASSLDAGSWTNVSGTQGQHQFLPTRTNSSAFYRVAE